MGLIYTQDADKINQTAVSATNPMPMAANVNGGPVSTANPQPVKAVPYTFLGYQEITAATLASSSPLPSIPATATIAIIQNNTNQIVRFRVDGATTPPTTTTGSRIAVAGSRTQDSGQANLVSMRLIVEAAATGSVGVEYYN